jgi:hypothetical protein
VRARERREVPPNYFKKKKKKKKGRDHLENLKKKWGPVKGCCANSHEPSEFHKIRCTYITCIPERLYATKEEFVYEISYIHNYRKYAINSAIIRCRIALCKTNLWIISGQKFFTN